MILKKGLSLITILISVFVGLISFAYSPSSPQNIFIRDDNGEKHELKPDGNDIYYDVSTGHRWVKNMDGVFEQR